MNNSFECVATNILKCKSAILGNFLIINVIFSLAAGQCLHIYVSTFDIRSDKKKNNRRLSFHRFQ